MRHILARSLLLPLLLITAAPAFARSHPAKPPVPCSDVWNAVTQTLDDSREYTIIFVDGSQMRAVFSVFAARFPQIDAVKLKPHQGTCELNIRMGFTGNDDEWAFRRRVNRSLQRLETAKVSPAPKAGTAE